MARVTRRYGPDRVRQAMDLGLQLGVTAWGSLAAQRATQMAPVDTGRLARSIHRDEQPYELRELAWSINYGTNVVYAAAHEFGSGIHSPNPADRQLILIEAKNASALAFEWKGGPRDYGYDPESGLHFFKRVYHPGVPAHPYLRPAARDTLPEGRRLILEAIREQFARLA